MMKKLLSVAVLSMMTLLPTAAQADWSGYYKVEQVMATNDGVRVKLKGFDNKDPKTQCANKNEFWFKADDPTMMAKLEVLLAAKINDLNVNISYHECSHHGFLVLSSALLV